MRSIYTGPRTRDFRYKSRHIAKQVEIPGLSSRLNIVKS